MPPRTDFVDLGDRARTALAAVAADAELQALLAPHGYDDPGRAEGSALVDRLAAEDQPQLRERMGFLERS